MSLRRRSTPSSTWQCVGMEACGRKDWNSVDDFQPQRHGERCKWCTPASRSRSVPAVPSSPAPSACASRRVQAFAAQNTRDFPAVDDRKWLRGGNFCAPPSGTQTDSQGSTPVRESSALRTRRGDERAALSRTPRRRRPVRSRGDSARFARMALNKTLFQRPFEPGSGWFVRGPSDYKTGGCCGELRPALVIDSRVYRPRELVERPPSRSLADARLRLYQTEQPLAVDDL